MIEEDPKGRPEPDAAETRRNPPGPALGTLATWIPWTVAVGAAAACLWCGRLGFSSRIENSQLRDQLAMAEFAGKAARNQLEAERIIGHRLLADARQRSAAPAGLPGSEADAARLTISILTPTPGGSPEARAVAVWNPATQAGILQAERLPALPENRVYAIWLADPATPGLVSGGVFTVDAATGAARVRFQPARPPISVARFTVSVERKDGAAKPEGAVVLQSR